MQSRIDLVGMPEWEWLSGDAGIAGRRDVGNHITGLGGRACSTAPPSRRADRRTG
jgi:hypothetical protein